MASTTAPRSAREMDVAGGVWARPWRFADYVIVAAVALIALLLVRWVLRAGLTGWPVIVWLLACVVVIPTARNLSTRILYNLVFLCAMTYLDWLTGLRLPGTHGARILGCATVLAVASLVIRALGLSRQNALKIQGLDLLPPVFVSIGAPLMLRHWYAPKSAAEIYGTIAATWDNTSHYYLVSVMHSSQAMTRRMPPPVDGSENGFLSYPVGYHSWAASLLDLVAGPQPQDAVAQGASFLHVVALVVALNFLLVGCAVAAIPAIRSARLTGYLAVSLAMSFAIFGPAFWSVVDGHYNFQFSVTMVFAAFAISQLGARPFACLSSSALLFAIMCAGGGWLPMGALAAMVSIGIVLPINRETFAGNRGEKFWVLTVATAVFIATGVPALWASGEFAGGVFNSATGSISSMPSILLALTVLGLVAVLTMRDRKPAGLSQARIKAPALVMLGVLTGFVVWQTILLKADGLQPMNYYPQKLLNGMGLTACLIVIVALAVTIRPATRELSRSASSLRRESWQSVLICAVGFSCFAMTLMPAFGRAGTPSSVIEKLQLAEPRQDLANACSLVRDLPAEVVGLVVSSNPTDTLTCAAERGLYTHLAWQLNADIMYKWDEAVVEAVREDVALGRAVLIVDPYVLDNFKRWIGPTYADRVIPW